MDKYEQLKLKIDEAKTKSLVKDEMKAFVQLLVSATNKNKEELSNLNAENIKIIKDSIAFIEENNQKWANTQDEKTNTMVGKFDAKIALLKELMEEVKTLKPKDGEPGKDADEEAIVDKVLAQIKLPEYKETVLDGGQEIADKLNTLEEVVDQKVIKGLTKTISDLSSNIAHNAVRDGAKLYTGTSEARVRELIATTPGIGSAGASAFTDLTDAPSSYASQALKVVRVNAGETGLEFTTLAGGGSPGGSDTQVQFNDGGSFGGDAGFTYNKTTNVATLNGGEVITGANTTQSIAVDNKTFTDGSDPTITMNFDLSGGTTGTGTTFITSQTAARSITFPDASGTVALTSDLASYLPLAGGVMTGNILMTSNKLIGGSTTTSDLTLQTTSGVGATGADMHFLVGNNGGTEAMTILNSGNVGIGTTNPQALLHINKVGHTDTFTAPGDLVARLYSNDSDGGIDSLFDLYHQYYPSQNLDIAWFRKQNGFTGGTVGSLGFGALFGTGSYLHLVNSGISFHSSTSLLSEGSIGLSNFPSTNSTKIGLTTGANFYVAGAENSFKMGLLFNGADANGLSVFTDYATTTLFRVSETTTLVNSRNASSVALTIKGAASQTANLQEWQTSAGAVLSAVDENGFFGIGTTSPTAVLHLKAGTATANTAPLKFNSGTLLTTAEAGAVEFLSDAFYGTITTGAARKTFAFLEGPTFTGTVTLPKTLEIQDTSADHQYVLAVSELTADRTITLPLLTGADTFVFQDHIQTLTNKTIGAGVLQLAENASIALDPAGSADGKYSGITIAGTAGTTLAFGDLVYLAAADSRWELADADAATTADRMLGMVVLAASADGDPTVILLVGNIRADTAFPALTIGSPVYVGETAGDIQVAIPTGADNVIRRVGYALTADEIYFNPSMDSQISVA